ncbi:MAG: methionine biosynthesis protein MetW [Deltaproteobacteria bacterium]|jgi:methionine biosynthesis protein MetW|nr:methionine biosynthesis protein MetW [Deltaproteobacteria bacterium]
MVKVLDSENKPLKPCTLGKANILVNMGRARYVSRKPPTIVLLDKTVKDPEPGDGLGSGRIPDAVRAGFRRLRDLHGELGLAHPERKPAGTSGARYSRDPGDKSPPRWQDRVILSGMEKGSYVLDLGCGKGELLERMTRDLDVKGQGVEVDPEAAMVAMEKGVAVLNLDVSEVLGSFGDQSFDYAVLESTLQTLLKPAEVLREMLRVAKKGIVSFPNFGHWRVMLDLFARGRMPVTPGLPHSWHDTPNIHLFTVEDLIGFCEENDVRVGKAYGLADGEIRVLGPLDNMVTEEAIFFLEKKAPGPAGS